MRALVAQNAHDGVKLGSALCELRADGVAEAVCGDRRLPSGVDQARAFAGYLQGFLKEITGEIRLLRR